MSRRLLWCTALAWPSAVFCQELRLQSGTLTVDSGTTLRIADDHQWIIHPSAMVINHGVIDLGANAIVDEPEGAPITGSGVERIAPAAGSAQPVKGHGGLGLRLDQAAPLPALVITRGHIPRTHPVHNDGIARWYGIEGMAGLDDATATLQYDDTELGGLNESLLKLSKGSSTEGPWVELASAADGVVNQVTGPVQADAAFITSFAFDPLQAVNRPDHSIGLSVLPSLTDGPATIRVMHSNGSGALRVLDSRGREVMRLVAAAASTEFQADFSTLSPGTYAVVSANGASAIFVKR